MNFKLTTPVLYLVFNRLDTVKRTFPEIQKAKPTQLFIGADGPRNKTEEKKIKAVREYILNNIDWKCNVKTLFRKKNLGCQKAISGAIDWFFSNVKHGIILEDDCLPDQSFFRFCQELLKKYKNNKRIMQISGNNFNCERLVKDSYYFSKHPNIWGWATWGRAWKNYKNAPIITKTKIKKQYPSMIEQKLMLKRLGNVMSGNTDTWAYPWLWTIKTKNGLCISPSKNLVENIGFSNKKASNTSENFWDNLFLKKKSNTMPFPLIHSKKIRQSICLDKIELYLDMLRATLKKVSLK